MNTTKAILPLLLLAATFSLAQELDGIPEHVVDIALNPKSAALYSGVMRKQLAPMGDAAAVAITKILSGKSLRPEIADRILLVIEFAFESPEAIVDPANQKPQTSLFVLAYLDQQPLSTAQRERLQLLRKKLKVPTSV